MKKHFYFLFAILAWSVAAPSAHGQTRSWMQNATKSSVAKPTASAVRPTAAPQVAMSMSPTGATSAPQAGFARVMPSPDGAAPAARPMSAPPAYYTAQAPTLAPPLGGTTVPPPTIAPSIIGNQPTFPMQGPPQYAAPFGAPASTTGPMWSDGSMPVDSLTPANMQPVMPAPTAAPPVQGQPTYAAPTPQNLGTPNFTPPAGYGPPPNYSAAPSNFAPSPMGPGCEPEVPVAYDPGAAWEDPPVKNCGPWFVSVAYIMLTRDAPNNVPLTYENTVPQITVMNSESAGSHLWEDGGEIRFGRALGTRWAVEGVYWGLNTMSEQIGVNSQANTLNSRLDFENISYQGAPLSTVFDDSRDQRVLRQDVFENIEINLMQQALQVDPANRFGLTSFAGVRYFRFDEKLHLEATAAGVDYGTVPDDDPNYSDYRVITHNRMLGGQFGARGTLNLGSRFRLFAIPRFGIYGNDIRTYQHVCRTLNMSTQKIDVALMGQLDVGASYQILPCVSLFASYRGMGFAGVATSDDNMTRSFGANGGVATADIADIKSGGSLILHGWQSGIQWQF